MRKEQREKEMLLDVTFAMCLFEGLMLRNFYEVLSQQLSRVVGRDAASGRGPRRRSVLYQYFKAEGSVEVLEASSCCLNPISGRSMLQFCVRCLCLCP